jgi:hypothetical protein
MVTIAMLGAPGKRWKGEGVSGAGPVGQRRETSLLVLGGLLLPGRRRHGSLRADLDRLRWD